MRLKILVSLLALVTLTGVYFYGYNKGSKEERLFIKEVLLPLCYLTTLDKNELGGCLWENLW